MALIKCRECGADISDQAGACPKCGCPINIWYPYDMGYPQNMNPSYYQIPPQPQQTGHSGMAIAALVTAFFVPVAGFVLGIIVINDKSKPYDKGMAAGAIAVSVVVFFLAFLIFSFM